MEKEIFKGRLIRLALESKKIKGQTVEFEKVYLPASVHVFVITAKGLVKLVRERRWDRGGRIKDKVAAGIVEPGEKPLAAAKRELREELGLRAGRWQRLLVARQQGTVNDKRIYYVASRLQEAREPSDPTEDIVASVDYGIEELHRKMLDGHFGTSPTSYAIMQLYIKRSKWLGLA